MGQQRAAAPKPTPPGPLARKIVSALQQLQRQKVIDLSAWRAGHQQAEAVAKTLTSAPELAHLDPLHALYVYAQNQLAVMIDQLAELPPLAKLTNAYVAAEDDYMPSGLCWFSVNRIFSLPL